MRLRGALALTAAALCSLDCADSRRYQPHAEHQFISEKGLARDLAVVSNHIPNRYTLSFQPQSPHPGFHAISLTVPDYARLEVSARKGYWAEPNGAPAR